jgi:dTDP-glucose 4,6-dehydratase
MKNLLVTVVQVIGSNFVRYILQKYPSYHVVVFDKLTYAGNLDNLEEVSEDPALQIRARDITDRNAVNRAGFQCD